MTKEEKVLEEIKTLEKRIEYKKEILKRRVKTPLRYNIGDIVKVSGDWGGIIININPEDNYYLVDRLDGYRDGKFTTSEWVELDMITPYAKKLSFIEFLKIIFRIFKQNL